MEFDAAIDNCILSLAQLPSTLREDPGGVPWFFLLRSIPLALGGLGIPRQSGIDGETACLLSRETSYLFLESHYPGLIFGTRANWPAIDLGGAEDVTIRGIDPHEEELFDSQDQYPPLFLSSGEMYILDIADKPEVPLEQRRDERMLWYRAAGPNGVSTISARTIRRAAHKRRALLLIKYLDGRDMQSRSIWLRRSQFKGSGRWLDGPGGGIFYGPSAFRSAAEYRSSLRMRLLQSPASSDVGASDGTVLCSCKRLINIHDQPFHCIDCAANQCFFIGRHNAVRDILIAFLRRHRKDALAIPTEPLVTATSTAGDVGVIAPRLLSIRGTSGQHSCSPSASGAPLACSKGTRTRPARTRASSLLQVSSILMLRSRTRRLLRTCRSQPWTPWALRFGQRRALR